MRASDLTSYFSMLTNPNNINNGMQSMMHASRPIADLDEATKFWQLGKDMLLGDAVTSYFSSNNTAIWKWDLSRQSLSGDFLGVPIMREVIMRASTPSMSGAIPGIETIVGAALGVNGGQGHSSALRDYGADGLFGLIKTSIGLPTTNDEIRKIAERAFKIDAGWTSDLDSDKISPIVLPSYMKDELKNCIACNFEYEKIPVQRCEPNMNYNYLTGKCEKLVFSGFNPPPDCFNVCENIKTPTTVPEQIKECEGTFYYDISRCNSNGNILTNDATTNAIEAGIGAVAARLLSAFLSDRNITTDIKNICDCFDVNNTPLEKQIICEAFLHLNKKGNCNSEAFLKGMDTFIKDTHSVKDGQVFNCSLNWCALFVAYNLLKSYEKTGLNIAIVKQTLTGYNWAVRFLVRDLLRNKVGEQSLVPRVGSISFSGSYVSNGNDHIGIVVCVDTENKKFYVIEGNVLDAQNVPSVNFVEYDFSEIAKEKTNENTTDFSYSSTANFEKQIRFIHLLEKEGQWEQCGQCEDTPTTVASVPKVPTCIVKTDCIENNKNYHYAVFTSDGWYVYSGDGFGKHKANIWLKLQDPTKCDFTEIKCNSENCDCVGCDCETLQDKLNVLKNDLQTDTEQKYKNIIAKIEAIPQTADNKDLLLLLKELLNDVKKGVLLVLNDGDNNTIIDNKTTEILLLLSELRKIITELKYCEIPELTAELKYLKS